jgi:hypothetical protein
MAVRRFLIQLYVCEERVRRGLQSDTSQEHKTLEEQHAREVLILDTQTYYTVAHHLLKLAAQLLRKNDRNRLEEPVFKSVATIRNKLIRHAYVDSRVDIPNSFGYSVVTGPSIVGTTDTSDPGLFVTHAGILELLQKYSISNLWIADGIRQKLNLPPALP